MNKPLRAICATVLLALVTAVAAAAPAGADSIAYIKDGDVWLASPDGKRKQQVTRTGIYSYVSQADNGTLIALAPGERLHKLSRTGTVLADFATMVSDGAPKAGPVDKFGGPFEPEISPDGKLVAFEWFNDSYSNGGSNCNSSSVPPCYVLSSRSGVGITHSDRLTGPEEFGLLTGWIYPHWMSNDKLLRSSPGAILNENTVFNTVGPGKADKELKRWFFDANGGNDVFDVELSRDLKTIVGIVGQQADHLRVYRPLFDPYNAPEQKLGPFDTNTPVVEPCYEFNGPVGGKFESPSLSDDGRRLAYGVGNGIWVASLPDLAGGCQQGSDTGKLVIPGGRFAHWGPAGIPPKSAYGGVQLRVAGRSLGTALSKGLALTASVPGKGRLSASASFNGTRVATGARAVKKAGAATLKLRFVKQAALKGRRSAHLKVAVAFTPAGGGKAKRTSTAVTLKR